jgi:hypothetical protein
MIMCKRCGEWKPRASGELCDTCRKAVDAEEAKKESAAEIGYDRAHQGETPFMRPKKFRKAQKEAMTNFTKIMELLLFYDVRRDDMWVIFDVLKKYMPQGTVEGIRLAWGANLGTWEAEEDAKAETLGHKEHKVEMKVEAPHDDFSLSTSVPDAEEPTAKGENQVEVEEIPLSDSPVSTQVSDKREGEEQDDTDGATDETEESDESEAPVVKSAQQQLNELLWQQSLEKHRKEGARARRKDAKERKEQKEQRRQKWLEQERLEQETPVAESEKKEIDDFPRWRQEMEKSEKKDKELRERIIRNAGTVRPISAKGADDQAPVDTDESAETETPGEMDEKPVAPVTQTPQALDEAEKRRKEKETAEWNKEIPPSPYKN